VLWVCERHIENLQNDQAASSMIVGIGAWDEALSPPPEN
jgi:hypothetical protein